MNFWQINGLALAIYLIGVAIFSVFEGYGNTRSDRNHLGISMLWPFYIIMIPIGIFAIMFSAPVYLPYRFGSWLAQLKKKRSEKAEEINTIDQTSEMFNIGQLTLQCNYYQYRMTTIAREFRIKAAACRNMGPGNYVHFTVNELTHLAGYLEEEFK